MLPEKFLKPYNAAATEPEIYKKWEESGYFNPDNLPASAQGSGAAKPYTIIMPPPNVTGVLHMGHALMLTIEDILIRYKRMRGFKTLWLPGTDHAAIATQSKVEKDLAKEGTTRSKLGREEFLKRVETFAAESRDTIVKQIRVMGASCDWSREAYTLDEKRNRAVNTMFKMMYDDGLIYRGSRIINWDPKGQTTISDDEIVYIEEKTKFYYFQYGPFVIGTARPETKFGDKYVVVHPNDKRYAKWKHGDTLEVEWINGPITTTVIKDEAIDMEFGTGVMTITPWHSQADFEIAERHGLDKEQIIDEIGKLLPIAREFAGMKIAEARPKIVEKLKEKGLLVKEEEYTHNIATAERTSGIIEPQIKLQWFVNVNKPVAARGGKTLKELMREPLAHGDIKILPEHFDKTYFHWIDNLRDWCISRQIWFGHRVPVWYRGTDKKMGFAGDIVSQVFDAKTLTYRSRDHGFKKGDIVAFEDSTKGTIFGYGTITEAKKVRLKDVDLKDQRHWKTYETQEDLMAALKRHHPEKEFDDESPIWLYTYAFSASSPVQEEISVGEAPAGDGWRQDEDTLDTWFSSGLWTFSTLGWPEKTPDLKLYHPTDVLETGYEILFFWVARMILMSQYALGEVPFHTVYLHGTVRDQKGRKMSKSLGNGIDPIEVAKEFGADAGRMALIVGNTPGMDTKIWNDKIKAYKLFANKLWNISRFVLEQQGDHKKNEAVVFTNDDLELLRELDERVKYVTEDLENHRLYLAAEKLYQYIWHNFADTTLEDSKRVFEKGSPEDILSRKKTLLIILETSLKLLHPFMPFLTEEIWSELPGNTDLLMVAPWPAH